MNRTQILGMRGNPLWRVAVVLMPCALLAACGQTGPLYLPAAQPAASQPAPAAAPYRDATQ